MPGRRWRREVGSRKRHILEFQQRLDILFFGRGLKPAVKPISDDKRR
ncbi:MAG: hypothetical protein U1A77_04335 [Pirellulales bacterium]